MNTGPVTRLYVCNTCRPPEFDGEAHERPGACFGRALKARCAARGLDQRIAVQGVDCLSVCKRPCTVAVSGAGKFTYVIGDLEVDTDLDAILDFAQLYAVAEDGITVWRERPEKVRKNTVARIPAFGHDAAPVVDIEG